MKVKRMIKSDVDTFKVGDIIKVKLTDKTFQEWLEEMDVYRNREPIENP